MRRVGLLFPGPLAAANQRAKFVWDGLNEKTFVEGKNLALEVRAADYQPDGLARLAQDLATSDVAAIIAVAPPAVKAAKAATSTKAIVAIDLESDPEASGFVSSLAHPGGNLIGLFFDFPEFSGKWLELLQEAVPGLARVAVLWDPTSGDLQVKAAQAAAAVRGVQLQIVQAKEPSEIDNAFAAAIQGKAQGLLMLSSPLFNVAVAGRTVANLATQYHLPAISPFPEFAQLGGLMGYGASVEDLFHQAGVLVARILNGEKPADIPVERPSRLHLCVNLQAAKALAITLPPVLLARADEVIE